MIILSMLLAMEIAENPATDKITRQFDPGIRAIFVGKGIRCEKEKVNEDKIEVSFLKSSEQSLKIDLKNTILKIMRDPPFDDMADYMNNRIVNDVVVEPGAVADNINISAACTDYSGGAAKPIGIQITDRKQKWPQIWLKIPPKVSLHESR